VCRICLKFSVAVLYRKLSNKHEYNWSRRVTVVLYLREQINFHPYFSYFLTDLGESVCSEGPVSTWGRRVVAIFVKNLCFESHTLCEGLNKIIFLIFEYFLRLGWIYGTWNAHKTLLIDSDFRDYLHSESHTLFADERKWISCRIFHICWLIWVKMLVMPLIFCEFHENRRREGRTFHVDVNEIKFSRVQWNCVTFLKQGTPWCIHRRNTQSLIDNHYINNNQRILLKLKFMNYYWYI
jgi:hypothetical protein